MDFKKYLPMAIVSLAVILGYEMYKKWKAGQEESAE
jgi:uncharacterized membrane protein (UPF0136 family)